MLKYNPAHLDRAFHALADPARRAMVERLCEGPLSVGDLAAPFDMSLSAVMQHLAVLETDGLVTTHKQGRVRVCALAGGNFRDAAAWFESRLMLWQRRLDRLDAYLAETAPETAPETPRKRRKK